MIIPLASTLSHECAGTLCLQLLHCPASLHLAVSGSPWISHHNVATFLHALLPRILLWWLVHTDFCSALVLDSEFFFEMTDSVAGHCYKSSPREQFWGKVFSLFPTAVGPSRTKKPSQLCSNMTKWGRVGGGKKSIKFPCLFCNDFPDCPSFILVRNRSHQKNLDSWKYSGI